MSTLGKVLTFLNVLAAVLLLVIAGMDYGEARAARYAVFRHEIAARGLPTDADEIDPEYPDEPIAAKLAASGVLADVFKGAQGGADLGGPEVRTVSEEVDRVRQKIGGLVSGAADKKKAIERFLLTQARDVAERDRFKEMAARGDTAAAQAELDKRFQAVKERLGGKTNENRQDFRLAAARLFAELSIDKDWLERVRVVCGMDALAAALSRSAQTQELLTAGVRAGMVHDQAHFLAEYEATVNRLLYEHEDLYEANKKLAEWKKYVQQRQAEVEQRRTEVERNRAELAALTGEAGAEVARLDAMQRDLFAVQHRLAQAQDAIYKLEEQLRQRAGRTNDRGR